MSDTAGDDPLDDEVSEQYERWMYPAPIFDLPAWLENNWQWFDPSHAHPLFWPDRDYRPGLDILIAGCGTNQAAVIAFTNPTARIVAIDVSESSLGHHRHLKETYGLGNLEIHRLPIERVQSLDRHFDLIISTGVLHHLADPQLGMDALAGCLQDDGVLAVMLYARYGRLGVQMLQWVFADLGLRQDESALRMVRDAINHVDPRHPVHSYLGIAPDLDDDAGLIDTFLHGRERTYTIDECRELVTASGLVFQDLFLKASYFVPRGSGDPFFDVIAELSPERQWSIMERINARNACHFFMACKRERPRDTYAISFDSGDAMSYMPALRHACRLDGDVLHRHDWQMPLEPTEAALLRQMDGDSSIADIVVGAQQQGTYWGMESGELMVFARELFQRLWQLDFVAVRIPGAQ